jgi:hypothetical protein
MIFQAGRRTAKKMGKNAHFVLKICTNRFRDYKYNKVGILHLVEGMLTT